MASSSSTPKWTYDVFLSFRGEDTRTNFVDHLYTALDDRAIYTFKDDHKLQRGKSISAELLKAIEQSRFAVVVFSRNYADSPWCLDELAKIVDCRNSMGQTVLPVFYYVDPSDLRKQTGCVCQSFAKHEINYKDKEDQIQRWRNALAEAASISGWDLPRTANGHEAQCIKQIVGNILTSLRYSKTSSGAENLIGVESRVQNVRSLLHIGSDDDDVQILGIWGMGGVGKTTIAKAVFDDISNQFEGRSFVANVRESSKRSGLQSLQEQILSAILMERELKVRSVDEGINMMSRLSRKRVLLVLDDVDRVNQLEALAGKREWFGMGSKIIITTRYEHLLVEYGANEIHPVDLLNFDEALRLFIRYAFRSNSPMEEYVELSHLVVRNVGGLPLVLKVLGSFLYGRDMVEWKSALHRLKDIPDNGITDMLKISFDALKHMEKDIFLDIALYFIGMRRDVSQKLVSLDFHPGIGIGVTKKDTVDDNSIKRTDFDVIISNALGFPKEERLKIEKEVDHGKQENVSLTSENTSGTKSGKLKVKGLSLIELFTPEQVSEHITSLRLWVGQSEVEAEKNQAMEHSMSESSCQLCAVEELTFEPPPIYCTQCGACIKRNAMYYAIGSGNTRIFICILCYNEAHGDIILVDTNTIPKARLEEKKNDEDTEEWWVHCDKCEAWQHQICALFNGRRNDGGQAEYTCPNCYIKEVERGERTQLPESAVLGAKDLPRTILSDHIEQRLFRRLKQERIARARVNGKSYDEVPGAESLVIRVVSSVDKKLEVKQRFLEIFQEENYPSEFAYKSKAVLLFQKIGGVEVCLFCMYVQEFGSECQQPNHRRVYLSYLDSGKYFRPQISAVTGEALRTFVYHEILIGYLEYCKKRGFTGCCIWACPPLKGEDYILYCHPEIQNTPKSDQLREWYLSMLRKAMKENIVVDITNLYDHFFVTSGECKAKVTAARLPYFDGDYWPGAAEDIIYQIRQEEDGRALHKKGTTTKITTKKRALKASGEADLSGNASKDLLMHKLGESISLMKEDFIMVHLQHACTHCCILMVSGNRWVCNQCKNFQLCDKCYEAEQQLEERERHPTNRRYKHALHPVEINNVAGDTKDKDETLQSEIFDIRQDFLNLCRGNHYQFNTLRRAKHSSMMVLYHLHNPTAPAFVTRCNICHLDIESGQGWRCEICPDYDVCNACFQKDGGIDHPHKLTNHPSLAERDAQNKVARQLRVVQLRKMLDLLVHSSQCRFPQCLYPNCTKVKGLLRHGIQCKTRASGGCVLCKKMWYLLQLHSRACKESECHVPRCRDLMDYLRRLQQQSDSRRRAAVMEMMRQRAAEVASSGTGWQSVLAFGFAFVCRFYSSSHLKLGWNK